MGQERATVRASDDDDPGAFGDLAHLRSEDYCGSPSAARDRGDAGVAPMILGGGICCRQRDTRRGLWQ